jgi:DNA-binding CsgD family transcriptional regulator
MSKSACLRCTDVTQVIALAGECQELGSDPAAWRRHHFGRLADLAGADFALGGELAGLATGRPKDLGTVDWGRGGGFPLEFVARVMAEFRHDPMYAPTTLRYFREVAREDGVCRSRRQLIRDAAWYRCDHYELFYRGIGIDHSAWCFARIPAAADEYNGVVLFREPGSRDFSDRQRALVRAAVTALAPLVGARLARFREPSPAALAPRVRQTLTCLLEGDADKQAAARLGLTRHTVNQYVKQIYRHYGVTSRPELLALWVRRGWGTRFASPLDMR